jgi:hypothetical protein
LIRNDFSVQGVLENFFFPEFPGAAGKRKGRHYPAVCRPLGVYAAAGSAISAAFDPAATSA